MALPLLIGTCRLADLIGTPKAGFLVVSPIAPDSLQAAAANGSTAPRFMPIIISNSGEGVLEWRAHIQGSSAWLSLVDSTGSAPDTLFVRMDPTGLDTGIYHDTVVVAATGASGVAQSTPIKFEINPCTEIPILVNDSLVDTLTSADCGAPHRDGSYARIYRFNGTANDSISVYMAAAEFNGYVFLDTSLTAPPLAQQDDCLGATGNPCIFYQRLPATKPYFVEVTSFAPAESGEFTLQVPLPRAPNLPTALDQRSDSVTIVPPGGTLGQATIILSGIVTDRDLGDSLHLEAEVRPNTTSFNGTPTGSGGANVANGERATVTANVLDNTAYHWRVRAVDNTGRAGAWVALGGNPDFTVNMPQPPNSPSGLGQSKPDGTPLTVGAVADTDVVVLSATVTDPDPSDQLRLQVEVKAIGIAFADVPTDSSPAVGSGIAQVSVGPLGNNASYHWQARTSDQTGRTSAWIRFGGNAEPNGVDFRIALAGIPNAVSAMAQYQNDGTTTLPLGGVTATQSVVLKGVVSDPDVGQTVQMEVEVKPTSVAFIDAPNYQSTAVANGALASVTVGPLSNQTDYHWQARAKDATSRTGAWLSFPQPTPNLETDPDFKVQTPPVQLVFTVQPPASTVAGVNMAPPIQVTARDINGNTATGFIGNVVMTLENAPGATLLGTTTVAAVGGVATFNDLHINKSGNAYNLRATTSSPPLTQTSTTFNITPAPTSQLVFTINPPVSTQAGSAMTPAIVVAAQDAFFNTTASFAGPVTLSITPGTGTAGAILTGGGPITASNGVATFPSASIQRSGTGYTLTASSGVLKPDTSTAFTITAGLGTHLVFTVQPSNAGALSTITPPVQVTARDANENNATGFTGSVTVAIGANPPGNGILSGTLTVGATAGTATFSNLSIDKTGDNYTLVASGLGNVTSTFFNIVPSQVSPTFSTVAANPTAITACATGCSVPTTASTVTVTARDQGSNPVAGASATISVTGGATISPPGAVVTNGSGVATWTLTSTASGPKGISAVISSISIIDTATVNVNAATATQLVFTTPPANTTAGVAINSGTGVVVTARDQFGNTATSFTSLLTMAIAAGPVGGVFAPTSTNTATPAAGVATFPNLRIYKSGSGYQLQASGGALTSPLSGAFTINTAPVSQLAFVVQPSTTADSAPIAPPVQVAGQDSVGNTVTTFTGVVRMFIDNPGTNPGGGTLPTTQVNAVNGTGIATFSNLRINARGTGYTLLTTSSGLTDAISDPFDIIAGPAAALFFTVQPSQTVAGNPITPAVTVTARDNQGNTATSFFGNVTLTIGTNPPGNGILTGGGPLAASAGVVSFPAASIDKAGTGYTLVASATGLTGTTSTGFTIISGGVSPTLSTIARAPTSITASGGTITSTITVTARDNLNNPIQGLAVVLGATGTGNFLTQPVATTNASGVATGTLASTVAETKTISATIDGTLINATTTVVVNPAAAKQLQFILQPTTTVATQIIRLGTGVTVEVRDTFSNRVTSAGNSVNIAILNNAGTPVPGTLTGTTPKTPVGGTVTFSDLSIDKIGTGYTLLASSPTLVSDTSAPFNITVGTATKLGFVQQPTNTAAGASITPAITVEVLDAGTNRVTSASNAIGLAILNNPSGGSLSGDANNNAASGLATFGGLSINNVGLGYTLQATATGLAPATSAGFDITVGSVSASQSTVVASQTPITACDNSPPCTTGGGTASVITVTAKDGSGNPVPGASVTLAVTGTGNGTNPGGLTQTADGSGQASWTFRSTVAEAKTASATINSVSITQTAGVTVNAAAVSAAQSSVGAAPGTITASTGSSTSTITVTVRDEFSNPIQGAGVVLSSTGSNNTFVQPGNTNSLGVTTGTFRSITAEGKTISATVNGTTLITQTAAVTVNPAGVSAAQSSVGAAPGTITASNGSSASTITVTVRDQFNNPIPGATVVLSATPTTGNALTQPASNTNSSGVATGSLSSTSAESKTVSATAQVGAGPIVAITQTAGVTVNPAAAAALFFTTEPPSSTAINTDMNPAVEVTARDQFGNTATGFNGTVTLDFTAGTNTESAGITGNSVAAVNGVATFSSIQIDMADDGSGYSLDASDGGGVTIATSSVFSITP